MWAYHSLRVDILVDGVVVDVEGGGDDDQLGGHEVDVTIAEELAGEAGHGQALCLHLGVVQRKLVVLVDLCHAAEGVPAGMPDEQILQVTCNTEHWQSAGPLPKAACSELTEKRTWALRHMMHVHHARSNPSRERKNDPELWQPPSG